MEPQQIWNVVFITLIIQTSFTNANTSALLSPSTNVLNNTRTKRDNSQTNCPTSCTCAYVENRKQTNCVKADLTEVPYGIPRNSMSIDVSGNSFGAMIQDDYFFRRQLQDVRQLTMRSSRITSLGQNVFRNMELLEKLDLGNNFLRDLPPNLFHELPTLKDLSLARNKFTNFSANTFFGATGLAYLDASENMINYIQPHAFSRLPRIKSIDLSNNRLQRIHVDVFAKIPTLEMVHLQGNPWMCDCHLKDMVSYLSSHKLADPGTCYLPAKLRGKRWDTLNMDEFACSPHISQNGLQRNHEIPIGGTLHLSCTVTADPQPTVKWQFHAAHKLSLKQHDDDSNKRTEIGNEAPGKYHSLVTSTGINQWKYSLNVTDFNNGDVGHYMCVVSNAADKVIEVFDASVADPMSMPSAPAVSSVRITPEMILIIVVLIAAILIVFFVCIVIICQRGGKEDDDELKHQPVQYARVNKEPQGYCTVDHSAGFDYQQVATNARTALYVDSQPIGDRAGLLQSTAITHQSQKVTFSSESPATTSLTQDDSGYLDNLSRTSPNCIVRQVHDNGTCTNGTLHGTYVSPLQERQCGYNVPQDPTHCSLRYKEAPLAGEETEDHRMPLKETSL